MGWRELRFVCDAAAAEVLRAGAAVLRHVGEGALAVDADGRQVGRAREVFEGQRVVAGLDGGRQVPHDFGAVTVYRDGVDLGGGGGDVRGGSAEREGGQQETGRVGHGDGHRMSASGPWCSLKG